MTDIAFSQVSLCPILTLNPWGRILQIKPMCQIVLAEAFHKDFAQSRDRAKCGGRPPHCPYHCAINLLPGASLPSSSFYSLSRPKRQVMQTYIHDCPNAGIICPASSPLAAGFFLLLLLKRRTRPCCCCLQLSNCYKKQQFSPSWHWRNGSTGWREQSIWTDHKVLWYLQKAGSWSSREYCLGLRRTALGSQFSLSSDLYHQTNNQRPEPGVGSNSSVCDLYQSDHLANMLTIL